MAKPVANPKPKKQGKAPNKRAGPNAVLVGAGGRTERNNVPAVQGGMQIRPTGQEIRNIRSPKYGEGRLLTGHQYVTSVVTTGADTQLFSGGAAASANIIQLSPDGLNGVVALESRPYSRFRFRRIWLEYTPLIGSTQSGGFAIGVVKGDGSADSAATMTYSSVQDIEDSMKSNFPTKATMKVELPGDELYYTEQDSTSIASRRLTQQGQIIGYPNASSIGALTMGDLRVFYELELYYRSADYGFSVALPRIKNQEEVDFVRQAIASYRGRKAIVDSAATSVRSASLPRGGA